MWIQLQDARGNLSTIRVRVSGVPAEDPRVGECFEATGLMVLERHWLDIYPWEKWFASKVKTFCRSLTLCVGIESAHPAFDMLCHIFYDLFAL